MARAYEQPPPPAGAFTHLVLLGSPHSVAEIDSLAWLKAEADWLRPLLDGPQKILGICLGAQLLAHLLGGRIRVGPHAEIGWHALEGCDPLTAVFQWHREVFSLPPGATAFGRSAATPLQGFRRGNIWALAGHPEVDEALAREYFRLCWSEEWFEGERQARRAAFIQPPAEALRALGENAAESRRRVYALLDDWAGL